MKNESTADRITRAILGVAFIALAYSRLEGGLMITSYVLGAILLLTSATGFCCLYKPLGINTADKETEQK
ncbi:DUF2892 domain-containing protein [Patescibacteria group bacterium]